MRVRKIANFSVHGPAEASRISLVNNSTTTTFRLVSDTDTETNAADGGNSGAANTETYAADGANRGAADGANRGANNG